MPEDHITRHDALGPGSAPAFDATLEFAVAAAGLGVWEVDLRDGQERWSDQTLRL